MAKKVSEEHANLFDAMFEGKKIADTQANENKALIDYKKSSYPYILKVVDKFFDILVNIGVNIIPALIMGIIIYKNYGTWFTSSSTIGLTGNILMAVWSVGAPAVLASGVLYIAIEILRIVAEGLITVFLSMRVKHILKRNKKLDAMIKKELKKRDEADKNNEQEKKNSSIDGDDHNKSLGVLYDEFIYTAHRETENNSMLRASIPSYEEWLEYYKYCSSLPGGNIRAVFRTKNMIKFYLEWKYNQK